MFRQKFCAVVGLLLVALLAWAPMAAADENVIDGLLSQLAVFLGLADEAGPNFSPGGLEMPHNPSPGGVEQHMNELGDGYSPGG